MGNQQEFPVDDEKQWYVNQKLVDKDILWIYEPLTMMIAQEDAIKKEKQHRIDRRKARAVVKSLMRELTEQELHVLNLRFVKRHTVREVAEIMGLSERQIFNIAAKIRQTAESLRNEYELVKIAK